MRLTQLKEVSDGPTTPLRKQSGLGFSAFARRYLRNLIRFLFQWLLRCFSSPRSLYMPYVFRHE